MVGCVTRSVSCFSTVRPMCVPLQPLKFPFFVLAFFFFLRVSPTPGRVGGRGAGPLSRALHCHSRGGHVAQDGAQ